MLLLTRSLIESTIKWRFDFFEACMIVMKGYLIDIEDPDDKNFRKKKNNNLKFLYILIMSKFGGASKNFFIDLTYKNFYLKIIELN